MNVICKIGNIDPPSDERLAAISIPQLSPNLKELAAVVNNFKEILPNEYVGDVLGVEELDRIQPGKSGIIAAEVSTGKTTAILQALLYMDCRVFFLTNRKTAILQQKKTFMKFKGINADTWDSEAVEGYDCHNVKFMTYQALAAHGDKFVFPPGSMIILDECHYLLNDSVFSYDPMIVCTILRSNMQKTRRIYMSATIEEVLYVIEEIEKVDPSETEKPVQFSISKNENQKTIYKTTINNTNINTLYVANSNWGHLDFRFYDYSDLSSLAEYIRNAIKSGSKTVIFIRSKARGEQLKELLQDCEFVYASETEHDTLLEIENQMEFSCSTLISTKVLENGVSIVDDKVDTIIIDEIDHISFKQYLGRVRRSRTTPKPLTVVIPDYKVGELKRINMQVGQQLNLVGTALQEPNKCMARPSMYLPYIYFSEKREEPMANRLAFTKLMHLKKHIDSLIEAERITPHAHIRSILNMLFLSETINDKQFLNYDDIAAFKSRVTAAFETFKASRQLKADRDQLAQALIKIVSETNVYPKKITGSQIQIDKINDILAYAGIDAKIRSLGETFEIQIPNSI